MTLNEHIEFFTELKQYMEFFAALEDSQLVANIEYKLINANIEFNYYYKITYNNKNMYKYSYYTLNVTRYVQIKGALAPSAKHTNRLFALKLVIAEALQMLVIQKALPES